MLTRSGISFVKKPRRHSLNTSARLFSSDRVAMHTGRSEGSYQSVRCTTARKVETDATIRQLRLRLLRILSPSMQTKRQSGSDRTDPEKPIVAQKKMSPQVPSG
jgi:hypothetical protein